MKILTLLLVIILVTGCSGAVTTFIVSGESLTLVAKEFNDVNSAYVKGCDIDKTLTATQCNAWIDFGEKFKQMFPIAGQAWITARKVNDAALTEQSSTMISTLVGQLATFGTVVGIQILGGS